MKSLLQLSQQVPAEYLVGRDDRDCEFDGKIESYSVSELLFVVSLWMNAISKPKT